MIHGDGDFCTQRGRIRERKLQPRVGCILLTEARHDLHITLGACVVFWHGEQVASRRINALLREIARGLHHAPSLKPGSHGKEVGWLLRTILDERRAQSAMAASAVLPWRARISATFSIQCVSW